MRHETWNDLALFAAVGEAGSFTGAARALGVSPSAVSHALQGLEERLGVRLLNRSTRSVAPTLAGEPLLATPRPAAAALDEAVDALERQRDRPAGRVRGSAHRTAALRTVMPHLRSFGRTHPDVEVEVVVDDGLVDIVAAGFDAGIRRAEVLQPDMISVRLDDGVRLAYVASPGYLAESGAPREPVDLLDHRWSFERDGERVLVDAPGKLVLNDVDLLLQAALSGCGIACVTEEQAKPHVASGALSPVLADWAPRLPPNYLYYAGTRNVPAALLAFIDEVRSRA